MCVCVHHKVSFRGDLLSDMTFSVRARIRFVSVTKLIKQQASGCLCKAKAAQRVCGFAICRLHVSKISISASIGSSVGVDTVTRETPDTGVLYIHSGLALMYCSC